MFRDVARGIAKNTVVIMFQHVVTIASSVLLMLFLPRYLGPIQYGWLFLGLSISQILRLVVVYGGSYVVTKRVARSPEETAQILVDSAAIRALLGILSIAAIWIFTEFVEYPAEERQIILLFALSLIWAGGQTVLYAGYQGRELMQYTSAGAVAERLFQVVTVLPAIWLKASVTTIAVLSVLGGLANFAILLAFARRIVGRLPRINWSSSLRELREGLPYFLFTVFGAIYYRIDSLMLSKMAPDAVVGWYGGAYRMFETLNFPYILTVAVYPVLSRLWQSEGGTHQRTMQKSLELVIMGGILITVGSIAFADKVIGIFYGLSQYGPSVLLLQILCAGLVFLYIDMILGTTLLSSDRQKALMLVSLAAIPVNIALNYLLIPYFQSRSGNGAIGAAIATGLTEVGITIACFSLLPPGVMKGFRIQVVIKSLTAGGATALFLALGSYVGIQWVVLAALAGCVFFACLWVLKVFEPAERQFLSGLLSGRGVMNLLRQLRHSIAGTP